MTEEITMSQEDDMWIINHEPTGVTTQGTSRFHALLMLADALAAYYDSDEDLLELSKDVFIMDDEMKEFMESLQNSDS